MMKLERTYSGVKNPVEQLKYIVEEHILESAPSLVNLEPAPAKRRKKNTDQESSDSDSCEE